MNKLSIMMIMMLTLVGSATAVSIDTTDLDLTGRMAIVSGTVYDALTGEPVGEGHPVRVYCIHDGDLIQLDFPDLVTSSQGMYSAWYINMFSGQCVSGDSAWVEVDYQGETFKSEPVMLVANGAVDVAGVDATVGVPEFNAVSLAAAVLIVGLGLVMFRKQI